MPSWNGRTRYRVRDGQHYDNACCGVFLVRDGRIAEVRDYLYPLHAAQVLLGRAM